VFEYLSTCRVLKFDLTCETIRYAHVFTNSYLYSYTDSTGTSSEIIDEKKDRHNEDMFDVDGNYIGKDNFESTGIISSASDESDHRKSLESTYLTPLPENYTSTIDIDAKTEEITKILKANSVVEAHFANLSPDSVTYGDFWQRYYYHTDVARIEQEWADLAEEQARQRRELVERGKNMITGLVGNALQVVAPIRPVDEDEYDYETAKSTVIYENDYEDEEEEEEELGWDESDEEEDDELDVTGDEEIIFDNSNVATIEKSTMTSENKNVSCEDSDFKILVESLQEDKKVMEEQISKQKTEMEQMMERLTLLKEQQEESDKVNDEPRAEDEDKLMLELNQQKMTIQEQSDMIVTLREQVTDQEQLKQHVDELKEQGISMENLLNESSSKYEKLHNEYNVNLQNLEEARASLESEKSKRIELEGLLESASSAKGDHENALLEQIHSLQTQLSDYKTKLETSEKVSIETRNRNAELESEITTYTEKTSELYEKITASENTIRELNMKCSTITKDYGKICEKLKENEKKVKDAESRLANSAPSSSSSGVKVPLNEGFSNAKSGMQQDDDNDEDDDGNWGDESWGEEEDDMDDL